MGDIKVRMTLQETLDDLPSKLFGAERCSREYWRWEEQASLEIRHRGFKDVSWWNEDSDGFGPLVRGVRATSVATGREELAYYG